MKVLNLSPEIALGQNGDTYILEIIGYLFLPAVDSNISYETVSEDRQR